MSQVRYRVATLTLGGLLLGVPLLANGTASAHQVEVGGRQVVFAGGGVLGLSCRSTPNVNVMTVPADSTVRVVNRTGHSARLQLGPDSKGTVPDDGATDVVFRRGTTAVQLSPSCVMNTESTPVLITVTPTPTPVITTPDPPSVPTGDPDEPTETDDPDDAFPNGGATSTPGSAAPATTSSRPRRTSVATRRPGVTRTVASRPARQAAATTTTMQIMPQGGRATSQVKTKFTRGTRTSAPVFSGMPPGDRKAIVPGVPKIELPLISEAADAAIGEPPTSIAAAEPVAAMQPLPTRQPSGLLALVAGVLALGVGIGTIQAFVSQRASRSSIA